MTPVNRKLRQRFARWAAKNGGRVLPVAQNEFARFIAMDALCIVYEKRGRIGAMVGDETAALWIAFEAKQEIDLSSGAPSQDGRREFAGRKAIALAVADIRSGRSEPLSVRQLCRSTGIKVRVIASIARANGGRVCGMKLGRAS